ncbi:MAG: BTAD domain-containing putative transcriptional regulator [Rubrivivax sp.]
MPAPDPSADPVPALRLLGAPELSVQGRRRAFTGERPFQLLAYLACKGGWVRRDELADLLYPGRGLEAARSNLRKVLLLARRVDGVDTIEHNGELLRWQPDSDLQRFERACDEGRFADAVALYGGPLLLGMDSGWPADAAGWLAGERSRLEGRWRDAALRRLEELRADPTAAEALAQALLRHDPLDDEAMRALLDAQGRLGRAGDALQAFQTYARQLAAALGLEPSAALQQLGSALRGADAGRAPPAPAPAAGAELIGRRQELAQLVERLTGDDVRLLTLLGPGGTGKTALARAALARLQPQFPDGAAWVDLEAVDAVERVPVQAALAMGLALDPRHDPWEALVQALGKGSAAPRLLVLDNAETLAADAGFAPRLAALLDAVPGLRMLATSRVVLGLRGEWRLPLDGLPLPDADETDVDALQANDAVRLFVRQALPLAPGFCLADEAVEVVQLVREVEGLPLALCLLAAWRRLMPVREILAELRHSLDLLEPSTAHERGVPAAFERSWRQLSPLQQRVLGQLALLPQAVDREMLRAVLHAPLPVVASLVDRSLVRADGDGRFSLHALIRRLAAPHAVDAAALRARHAHHMGQRAQGPATSHTAYLAALDLAIDHHRAAWGWALQAGHAALLQVLAVALATHEFERGPLGQVVPPLRQAATVLQTRTGEEGVAGDAGKALATVCTALSTLQFRLGQMDEAVHRARQVLELVDAGMPDRGVLADALITLFSVHLHRGDMAAAAALVPRYQAEARASGDRVREAYGHTIAGQAQAGLGRFDEALHSYEAARAVHVEIGDTASLPRLLSNMGHLLRRMQRPADAVRVLDEGLHWARRHGIEAAQPSLLTHLALAHEDLGDTAAMLRTTERALAAARQTTEPFALMRALLSHGRALAACHGDLAEAMAPIWQALRLAEQIRIGWDRHECLIGAARVASRCGRRAEADVLLRWVMAQSGLPPEAREAGLRAMQDLGFDPAHGLDAAAVPAPDVRVEDLLRRLAPEPSA